MTRAAALAALPRPLPIERVTLDNGLVVIARENRAAPSVAVQALFEAGAAFDPAGREGTAEMTASLIDRGAGALSAAEIADGFEFLGASFVARARRDTFEVDVRLLSQHITTVLERLRLILEQPTFPEKEIRRERAQTLTAIAEREQDTAIVADETVSAALYPPGHPYHASRVGTRDSVRRVERPDLKTFHETRIGPRGAILAIAGDLPARRAIDLAAAAFGGWADRAGRAASRAVIPPPPPLVGAAAIVRPIAGKTQADIALGFLGPERRSPDLPALFVMNSILGEFGLGGRLARAVRERAGLAYYAHSYFAAGLGRGPYMVRAGVASDRVRKAVDLIRRTLAGLLAKGVTRAEVSDSKQALASSIPRRMETNPDAASFLADAEFYGLGIDYHERLPALVRAVARDQVEEVARRYLTPGRQVLAVAGPSLPEVSLG